MSGRFVRSSKYRKFRDPCLEGTVLTTVYQDMYSDDQLEKSNAMTTFEYQGMHGTQI